MTRRLGPESVFDSTVPINPQTLGSVARPSKTSWPQIQQHHCNAVRRKGQVGTIALRSRKSETSPQSHFFCHGVWAVMLVAMLAAVSSPVLNDHTQVPSFVFRSSPRKLCLRGKRFRAQYDTHAMLFAQCFSKYPLQVQ